MTAATDDDNVYTIVIMGAGGVGKSALTVRMVSDRFLSEYDPTIEDSYRKSIKLDNENVVLSIIDTAGQEEFHTMIDQWIREGDGYILVFDINTPSTFLEIEDFHFKLQQNYVDLGEEIPLVLCGNKADLAVDGRENQVTKSEGDAKANEFKAKYLETSAKNDMNVEEAFFACARMIRDKKNAQRNPPPPESGDCPCCTIN